MNRILPVAACALSLLLVSCDKKQEVGKYVYVDAANTIHIDKECLKKNLPKSGKSTRVQMLMMEGVKFVDTCNLYERVRINDYLEQYKLPYCRFCPNCVTDEAFEQLQDIVNQQREIYLNQTSADKPTAY